MGPKWKRAKGGSGGPLEGGAHFTCCPGLQVVGAPGVPLCPAGLSPTGHLINLQHVPRGLDTRAVHPWASHALLSGKSETAMMMEGSELLVPTPSPSRVRTLGPGCSLSAGADSADCLSTFRAWGFSRAPLPPPPPTPRDHGWSGTVLVRIVCEAVMSFGVASGQ